ncbi:hypothetical protein MVEN_00768900 [Mycena venus]|uniref:Uncharacterized protein n=1 Tax=Mycena venus TaxID=2733690 RepID=A0A8H6YKK7_9AGAR|nr:hypothetical protein MVEN_00768900 [Mycena venus]
MQPQIRFGKSLQLVRRSSGFLVRVSDSRYPRSWVRIAPSSLNIHSHAKLRLHSFEPSSTSSSSPHPSLDVGYFSSSRSTSQMTMMENCQKTRFLALWARCDNSADDKWEFWRSFAATCLSETTISIVFARCESISELTQSGPDKGGFSVIKNLLAHDCDLRNTASIFSGALCFRYLAGILALPQFWFDIELHAHVAKKLCAKIVQVLEDIGVDDDSAEIAFYLGFRES